jgi:ABC-type uncharacterized transport system YnjBCD ATPase subunit
MPPQMVAKQLEQICCFDKLPPTIPAANILLLGPAGAGKSSLVSTLDSLLQGVMTRRAEYGGGTTTLTLALRKYTFPAASRQMLPLVLWDTRGWCPDSYRSGQITPYSSTQHLRKTRQHKRKPDNTINKMADNPLEVLTKLVLFTSSSNINGFE